MSMTVSVGYSEKLGQPNFGSIGASCHIECELDGRPVFDDPAVFHAKVRELYAACANAAKEELARHQAEQEASPEPRNGSLKDAEGVASAAVGKVSPNGEPRQHRASKRQLEFLEQLARQIPRMGVRRLESLSERVCQKPLAELSSFDASSLIDTLKAIKQGTLDLEAAVNGGTR